MKYIFEHNVQWSEQSEHSPQHQGQLPCAVVFPDGERVSLDQATLQEAQWDHHQARRRKDAYVQIHDNVRVRESRWGDDSSRRMGRAGSKLEVMAPKGSTFLFTRHSPGAATWPGSSRCRV